MNKYQVNFSFKGRGGITCNNSIVVDAHDQATANTKAISELKTLHAIFINRKNITSTQQLIKKEWN